APSPVKSPPTAVAISASVFTLGILSIDRRFAFGTRLPAPMDPQPLFGIFTDDSLDRLGEQRSIGDGVRLVITGADQLQRWFESQPVLAERLVPDHEGRDDSSVGPQRDACHPARGAC